MSEHKLTPKQVRIYAEGVDYLTIDQLKNLQGDFKKLKTENADKLRRLLEKRFISPFFIWENKYGVKMLLDGHQRSKVIPQMIKEGYEFRPCNRKGEFIDMEINTFPVIYIYAENENEAKENLLMISSQHGKPIEWIKSILLGVGAKVILDYFAGSGVTIIAAEKIGVKSFNLEIDPTSCDTIVNRYIDWMKENNREYSIKLNGELYEQKR